MKLLPKVNNMNKSDELTLIEEMNEMKYRISMLEQEVQLLKLKVKLNASALPKSKR